MKKISLSLLLIFMAGCSHNISMRHFKHDVGSVKDLGGKKSVIVIDPTRITDNVSTKAGSYTFTFNGNTEALVEALKERVGGEGGLVDVVNINELPGKKTYDYYLHPELAVRGFNDFTTMSCLVNFKLSVKTKDRLIRSESAEIKSSFFLASSAESECNKAMSEVFKSVTDKAIGAL